jgi:hypothetical protein
MNKSIQTDVFFSCSFVKPRGFDKYNTYNFILQGKSLSSNSKMEEISSYSTSNSTQVTTAPLPNETMYEENAHGRIFVVWISILIVIVSLLIIVLNLLVTFSFWRQNSHMESKNVCYVSIAISDFSSGVYLLTNTLAYLRTPMKFSFPLCLSLHTFGIILFYVSPYHILMLTMFQLIEIHFPFRPKSMRGKSFYIKLCCALWVAVTLVFIVPLIWQAEETEIMECSLLSVFGDYHKPMHLKTFTCYIVFLALQTFFSILLLRKIRMVLSKASRSVSRDNIHTGSQADDSFTVGNIQNHGHSSKTTEDIDSKMSKHSRDRYIRSAKTMFIYLFTYIMCTMPIMCMVFIDLILQNNVFHNREIIISLGAVAQINSIINPMLYFRRFHICSGCL